MSHTLRAPVALLAFAALAALAACHDANPAEVRTQGASFPVVASWGATLAPVGTGTVRATLAAKQHLGFRIETALTVTGAPNATYQWRIYRGGNCAVNAAATNATSNNGLWLFQSAESYPDVRTNAAGTGTATMTMAGALDSLGAYSVRVRVAQTATNWNGLSPVACGNLQLTQGG